MIADSNSFYSPVKINLWSPWSPAYVTVCEFLSSLGVNRSCIESNKDRQGRMMNESYTLIDGWKLDCVPL